VSQEQWDALKHWLRAQVKMRVDLIEMYKDNKDRRKMLEILGHAITRYNDVLHEMEELEA